LLANSVWSTEGKYGKAAITAIYKQFGHGYMQGFPHYTTC
jgi:hypothetical protein